MGNSDSASFYENLPVIEDFFDASNKQNYHVLPDDWLVAVTDIVDSTIAIENDRYKTVNILGASPIVGILNVAGQGQIPYVFGGDGASFCVPPSMAESAKDVLAGSRHIGKTEYDLELRTALIPVWYIREQGYEVRVARYQASPYYVQAVFSGGGISHAEELLKSKDIEKYRVLTSRNAASVDFTGLECRWQEVSQKGKEVITLLVKSNPSIIESEHIYESVLVKMRDIFGFDSKTNPIDKKQLQMNLSFFKLWDEAKFRTSGQRWYKRLGYVLEAQFRILLGKGLMALNVETSATDWSLYKSDLSKNSDHRKFDDMLRVVISGSSNQRKELESFLENQYQQDLLAYGIHITDAAMITCMVFQYHREHVHFVDGSYGGYVSASKGLKKRLSSL